MGTVCCLALEPCLVYMMATCRLIRGEKTVLKSLSELVFHRSLRHEISAVTEEIWCALKITSHYRVSCPFPHLKDSDYTPNYAPCSVESRSSSLKLGLSSHGGKRSSLWTSPQTVRMFDLNRRRTIKEREFVLITLAT